MPYFDFHIHPTLKNLFSHDGPDHSHAKTNPFEAIDTKKIPGIYRMCSDLAMVFNSQANLSQLFRNEFTLIGVPLFIPDSSLVKNKRILKLADSCFGMYIQRDQMKKLWEDSPIENILNEDLPMISDMAQWGEQNKTVKLLKNSNDFIEGDPNTINVFFTLEGIHSLCSKTDEYDLDDIKSNFARVSNKARVLATTLTHLQQSDVCGHAFGMQFISDKKFFPNKKGVSQLGFKLVNFFNQEQVLIDVKHMSLRARLELYNFYKQQNISEPIICTHAGLTGISYKDIKGYIGRRPDRDKKKKTYHLKYGKPVKYGKRPRPSFNISSINLYDEDVEFILQSGGMLGISLDKRILGFVDFQNPSGSREDFPHDIEYIYEQDNSFFVDPNSNIKLGDAIDDGKCLSWGELEDAGMVDPFLSEYHLKFFMQQIAHIFTVSDRINYPLHDAANQICLGSDFDGVINPIWTCDTTDEVSRFESKFVEKFETFCGRTNVPLPNNFDVANFARRMFYENGRDFVLSRLT